MNYRQYVERQKAIIKNNHMGEEYLLINGEAIPLRPADEILDELENLGATFGGAQYGRRERFDYFGQTERRDGFSRTRGYAV